jgi:DNA polymerase V
MLERVYACIDLKSFYASVECVERGLDPFKTNLVVSDPSRGPGAICLAITPAMKALGIPNRCRIFQIPKNVEYLTAKPRMKHYMRKSAEIYGIYLKYISAEDIHVYSIDECFLDLTTYLKLYQKTPRELVTMMMDAVLKQTGIAASGGIGTNLFLAKLALDITAKHADDGIGFLDEAAFKRTIWHHKPLTDIWNIGPGIADRLAHYGVTDLYGVAHMDEAVLYKEFGINAEFLIDHARGAEPCTIAEIHAFKPKTNSMTNGQILHADYGYEDALTALREMVDILVLEMIDKHVTADAISLRVGYSGSVRSHTGGTRRLGFRTNSYKKLAAAFEALYRETTDSSVPIRRINLGLNNVLDEDFVQLDMFGGGAEDEKERQMQEAVLAVKQKYGKNAILRGISLTAKGTAKERNTLVGGHNGE